MPPSLSPPFNAPFLLPSSLLSPRLLFSHLCLVPVGNLQNIDQDIPLPIAWSLSISLPPPPPPPIHISIPPYLLPSKSPFPCSRTPAHELERIHSECDWPLLPLTTGQRPALGTRYCVTGVPCVSPVTSCLRPPWGDTNTTGPICSPTTVVYWTRLRRSVN